MVCLPAVYINILSRSYHLTMEEWQKPETIALWISIIALFLIILLSFIALLSRAMLKRTIAIKEAEVGYQKDLLKNTIETQEKERERIAADLHDSLIGKLTALNMQFQMSGQDLNLNFNATESLQNSIDLARRISHNLSPPLIEFSSLKELILQVITPWQTKAKVQLRYEIDELSTNFNPEFKIQVIRILQELVTNAFKHGNSTEIEVYCKSFFGQAAVIFTDNGTGMNPDKKTKGLGLTNIETRVSYLSGAYKIKSKLNHGTRFIFLLPDSNLTP